MRFRRKLTQIAVATSVVLASIAPAFAAQVIVIIDGSGSSAGQIGGVAKIDIARGALRSILANSPSDLSIGLVAYGHRQREACNDIEVLAPPGPPAAFLDAAARVRSIGRSPIADATVAAANALTEDEATIILITDNSDNCSPNPCATIAALKDRMPGLVISVVGIAIPQDEVAEISCFADLTGGVYLRADNAANFEANLAEAMTVAWAERGPPPPPMPTASIAFPTDVVEGQPFTVEFQGPAGPGDQIRLAWAGTPLTEFIGAALIGPDGGPVQLTAPHVRGAYELRYWYAERSTVLARIPLRLQPITPSLSAPAAAQQGADLLVGWLADAHGGETIAIVPLPPLDAPTVVVPVIRSEPTVRVTAPGVPGDYEIRLVGGPAAAGDPPVLARAPISISAASISFSIDEPIVAGRTFLVAWTGPGGGRDEIRLATPDMPARASLSAVPPTGDTVRLKAPATGQYVLRYWSAATQSVLAEQRVDIGAATASIDAPAEVAGGTTFEVSWTGDADVGDRIAIVRPGNGGDEVIYSVRASLFGRPNLLDAPVTAGNYDIVYYAGVDGLALSRQSIRVSAAEATLRAPTTIAVGESIAVEWTGPEGRFDEIRLVNSADPTAILSAIRPIERPATLPSPAEPGLYLIQYWAGTAAVALATIELIVTCPDCAPAAPAPDPEPGPAPPPTPG
jgi:Ca-activated chloride channel family protein